MDLTKKLADALRHAVVNMEMAGGAAVELPTCREALAAYDKKQEQDRRYLRLHIAIRGRQCERALIAANRVPAHLASLGHKTAANHSDHAFRMARELATLGGNA